MAERDRKKIDAIKDRLMAVVNEHIETGEAAEALFALGYTGGGIVAAMGEGNFKPASAEFFGGIEHGMKRMSEQLGVKGPTFRMSQMERVK